MTGRLQGTDTPRIHAGVAGLGAMGAPMARNLAARGLLRAVWNRTASRAGKLAADLDAQAARSPAQLAGMCNVILTCVAADADLVSVIGRMLPGLRAGDLVVDTSTVSPSTARRIAGQLADRGTAFIDAPVSGGVEGAEKGSLAVMAGGELADIERIRPVFEAISGSVTHMGPVGSGQAAKAVNQVIVGGVAGAVCEALALAEKLNLPQKRLLTVLGAGAAGSWFLEHRGQSMLENRFETGFKPALLLKDLKIARALAQELDIHMPVVETAIADFRALLADGHEYGDISGLIRLKRKPAAWDG